MEQGVSSLIVEQIEKRTYALSYQFLVSMRRRLLQEGLTAALLAGVKCSKCGGQNVRYDEEQGEYVCSGCGRELREWVKAEL